MKCNASSLKKWCDETITPMAWQRITMKILPKLRDKGISLSEVENPANTLILDDDISDAIKLVLQELYQVEIPSEVIVG